jgi:hypothetical protein
MSRCITSSHTPPPPPLYCLANMAVGVPKPRTCKPNAQEVIGTGLGMLEARFRCALRRLLLLVLNGGGEEGREGGLAVHGGGGEEGGGRVGKPTQFKLHRQQQQQQQQQLTSAVPNALHNPLYGTVNGCSYTCAFTFCEAHLLTTQRMCASSLPVPLENFLWICL